MRAGKPPPGSRRPQSHDGRRIDGHYLAVKPHGVAQPFDPNEGIGRGPRSLQLDGANRPGLLKTCVKKGSKSEAHRRNRTLLRCGDLVVPGARQAFSFDLVAGLDFHKH